MTRRDRDRSIDSDPATRGALAVPKELEPTGDPAGMHREDDLDVLLDREARNDDNATVHLHEHRHQEHPDPQNLDELGADMLALATQGGGSFLDEGDDAGFEENVDREALAAGIVPQLVSQATLESASITDEQVLDADDEDAPDDDAPTLPRARPGETGVNRVQRRDAR